LRSVAKHTRRVQSRTQTPQKSSFNRLPRESARGLHKASDFVKTVQFHLTRLFTFGFSVYTLVGIIRGAVVTNSLYRPQDCDSLLYGMERTEP
jgi:hypothetical protein